MAKRFVSEVNQELGTIETERLLIKVEQATPVLISRKHRRRAIRRGGRGHLATDDRHDIDKSPLFIKRSAGIGHIEAE